MVGNMLDVVKKGYVSLSCGQKSNYQIYYKFNEKNIKIIQFKDNIPFEYFIFNKDTIVNIYNQFNEEKKKDKNVHTLKIISTIKSLNIINLDMEQYCNLFEIFFDWLESDVWINKPTGVNKL